MTAPEPDEDGQLRPALTKLADAIYRLTGPQTKYIDGRLLVAESRYMQLRDAIAGEQNNTGGGGGTKSRPPLWIDAADLLTKIDTEAAELLKEIDTTTEILQPAHTGTPPTVGRLRWLEARPWRPQDTRHITQITRAIAEWAAQIDALLNPPLRWNLPYPCPNVDCGATTAYHRDNAGEHVRQTALQINGNDLTVRCGACKSTWNSHTFRLLGRMLGLETPEGLIDDDTP